MKVASAATQLAGYQLAEDQKASAGSVVHYGFGAVVGAVYGAAAEIVPLVRSAFGLPFGGAVWLGAHVIAVPALGLAESPLRQPVAKEAGELGLHFVYGSVTELVRRLLRPQRGTLSPRFSQKISTSTPGEECAIGGKLGAGSAAVLRSVWRRRVTVTPRSRYER